MIIFHNHHIIPRHMGGTDEPSNLLKVNTALHAFLHKMLYEEHGSEYDRIAWRCLTGQITNEEANIEATKAANTGRKCSEKNKQLFREMFSGKNNSRYGVPRSEKEKKAISEGTKKGMKNTDKKLGTPKGTEPWNKGKKIGPHSPESNEKRRQAALLNAQKKKAKKEGPKPL